MAANNNNDLELLESVAIEAGKIALKYFKSENEVWMKPGDSPVSRADLEVNAYLEKTLKAARPDYGWISEESEDTDARHKSDRVFIIDPIDGTRGFIDGVDDWCISIAIVEASRPVVGLLECPALKETYCATAQGSSTLNGKEISTPQPSQVSSATGSKKINGIITEMFGATLKVTPFIPSLAYRLAKVATGDIDVAFTRPGAHEWDVAAADLILTNAGGALIDGDGNKLCYNREKLSYDSILACPNSLKETAIDLAKSASLLH